MNSKAELMTSRPNVVKLAVIGATAAGKSTLIARLVSRSYIDPSMIKGFDVTSWMISVDEFTSVEATLFEFEELGCIDVEGKAEPVLAFRV